MSLNPHPKPYGSTPCAQMGPSGSGKTTLLDVLAGRKTVGTVSGDVRIAGRPPTREFLRRYAGYVEQFGACQLSVKRSL